MVIYILGVTLEEETPILQSSKYGYMHLPLPHSETLPHNYIWAQLFTELLAYQAR